MLWSEKVVWDDPVAETIVEWSRWRSQLPLLSNQDATTSGTWDPALLLVVHNSTLFCEYQENC